MMVKCVANSLEHLSSQAEIDAFTDYVAMDEVWLEVGRRYVVYGVFFRKGWPWYLVVEEPDDEYPKPHFGGFFELVHPEVPPNWALSTTSRNLGGLALVPRQWIDEPRFLERLVDEDPDMLAGFRRLKEELREWHALQSEEVAPDAEAEELRSPWVMCPNCTESWESKLGLAVVTCPGCEKTWRNPHFGAGQ